jgi:hypothetical protein
MSRHTLHHPQYFETLREEERLHMRGMNDHVHNNLRKLTIRGLLYKKYRQMSERGEFKLELRSRRLSAVQGPCRLTSNCISCGIGLRDLELSPQPWNNSPRFHLHVPHLSNFSYCTHFKDHSKLLLSKEWLVKIDSQSSTPYLIVRL